MNINVIEKILFRRALENRLEGYTLETALEIAATDVNCRWCGNHLYCLKCRMPQTVEQEPK
jgi:hypothetical protein